jgi:hypothetical protein
LVFLTTTSSYLKTGLIKYLNIPYILQQPVKTIQQFIRKKQSVKKIKGGKRITKKIRIKN